MNYPHLSRTSPPEHTHTHTQKKNNNERRVSIFTFWKCGRVVIVVLFEGKVFQKSNFNFKIYTGFKYK